MKATEYTATEHMATEHTATEHTATEHTEHTDLPFGVRAFARVLPSVDRDSVLGDLLEEAEFRRMFGARRAIWLATECGAIAAGLSLQRVKGWFAVPPVREVVSGIALDGRGALRDGPSGALLRAFVFVASVATLAFAVEVLVRTLMTAAGL